MLLYHYFALNKALLYRIVNHTVDSTRQPLYPDQQEELGKDYYSSEGQNLTEHAN